MGLAVAALVLASACTASGSPSPASTASTTTTPGSSDALVTASPSVTTVPPFDPTAVSVTIEPLTLLDGAPLAFAAAPDGSGRVFVATKDGRILILRGDKVDPVPLLDIRRLVSGGGEQGLLGIAVRPDFPSDPRVFVDYTNDRGHTVVASYRISTTTPDAVDPSTATTILTVEQPYANHNGGAVAFGPDGMLYVSFGDGGSGGDPHGNGQNPDTLLGKILRLDVGTGASGSPPYVVPPDNPFVDRGGARPEIWLTGLRNPWRISFDRTTGDLWIGDVGQSAWEEIDVARAGVGGLNFGWNVTEGSHCYSPATKCPTTGLTPPVADYGHDLGCTVIGGFVYRGAAQPLLAGGYLFADYCSGRIWAIPTTGGGPITPTQVGMVGAGIVAFGEDADGELIVANLDGSISRVVASPR